MSGNINKKMKMIKNGVKSFVEKRLNEVRKDIDGVLSTFDQKIDHEVRMMENTLDRKVLGIRDKIVEQVKKDIMKISSHMRKKLETEIRERKEGENEMR